MTALRPRLTYLALETPLKGQAAATHIEEIIAALEALGWTVTRQFATRTGNSTSSSFAVRLLDYVRVQTRTVMAFPGTDVLFVRGHPMAMPAAKLARWCGIKVVHEINGRTDDIGVTYPGMARFMGLIGWLQRTQLQSAGHIFAVTDGLASYVRKQAGHDRVSIVPNGANMTLFSPVGEAHSEPEPYAVFVGSLAAWHGIGTLLGATRSPAWPVGVRLVLIGDGLARNEIATAARDCGNGRIVWLGLKPYAEIPYYLRGAIAALVPITNPANRSLSGVAPLKLFEAMACGVPVIATDLPFQAELVKRAQCGMIVPAGDADALAHAVAMIACDRGSAAAMGTRGRAAAEGESWAIRAAGIDATLRRLIGN